MTSKQFTKRRKRLWRTQTQAAEALGITPGACSHYEVGRRPVPLVVQKLLTCIESRTHLTA